MTVMRCGICQGEWTVQSWPSVCPTCVRANKEIQLKDTNPKDAIGARKMGMHYLPARVLGEVSLALLEGAAKYGSFNYRVAGVRWSVYHDAALRHLNAFAEGQDVDPDSGLSHITKAIAGLTVLRDSMLHKNWQDDRPPSVENLDWVAEQNREAERILAKYPNPKPPNVRKP